MRPCRNLKLSACLAATSLVLLAGCGAAAGGSAQPVVVKAAEPAAALHAAPVASTKCKDGANQVASLAPGNITSDWHTAAGSPTMKRIQKHKFLTAGTSGDVLLWGATDPKSGALKGFDIQLLDEIATYAGVDPDKTDFHVINYGQRLTALKAQTVDIVAHTMTINCDRWQGTGAAPNAINFSSEYYRAGQKVLVPLGSPFKKIQDLKGKSVCVPSASTNLANIQGMGLHIVTQDVIGNCLVMFQEGEVDAITGDDTVLAGFAAQDPLAVVVGDPFSEEPYGLGINADDPVFTQWVNAVLQKLRTDGTLVTIYNRTMGTVAGKDAPAFKPPAPVYGRVIPGLQRASS